MNITTTSENSPENRRFGFWGSLRLAFKLMLAFSVVLVFLLIIAGVTLWGMNRVTTAYEDTLAQGITIRTLVDQLDVNLLQARRNEKDFRLRWESQGYDTAYANYATLFYQHTAAMRESLKQLAPFGPVAAMVSTGDTTQAQYETDLTSLSQNTDTFETSFTALIAALQKRGPDENSGLQAALRDAAHNIEVKVSGVAGLESLEITYLSIRRNEKDYLARQNQTYVDEVHTLVTQLKTQISGTDQLDPATKTDLRAQADAYLKTFDEIVTVDKEIATHVQEMDDASHAIEPIAVKIVALGDQLAVDGELTARTNSTQTFTISIIAVAVVVFITIFISIVLSRQITRPVTSLTNTAEQIASGDFEVQAEVSSSDEVGTLAQTFNAMTSRLRVAFEDVRKRAAELATVAEVGTATATILEIDKLLQEVVNLTKERFNLYHSHIYLLDEAGENLVLAMGAGEAGRQMKAKGLSIPLDREQSLVARAARERKGVTVNDVTQAPDFLPNPLLPDTRSELAVPMIVGGNVIGVFDVQSDQVGRFGESDINIQTTLAAQVSTSIQNVRSFESARKIASDMGVVADVGIATSTITEAGHLLQEVVDLSKKSFNLYHAHIYLLNEAGDSLDLTAGAGEVGKQMVSEKRSILLDSEQSLVARAARTREGVVVNDVTVDPNFLPNPLLPDTRSEMAVPMIAAGKVIGVLDVQDDAANRFTDVDVDIQTTLASQVAVALQNARSFSLAQRHAERETSVNLITQKIQSATSIEAALQIAARELGHALGMKSTRVTLNPDALAGERKADA